MKRVLVVVVFAMMVAAVPFGAQAAMQPSGCSKRVPLYPGYPGYRGNVPGLAGVGDYLCLETLMAMDPSFSRRHEDTENDAAAAQLGFSGTYADWTWEHFMMIEAARGLPLQCYSCLLFDTTLQPTDPTIRPKPNDPRILAGLLAAPLSIPMLAQQLNQPQLNNRYQNDYELRVPSFLWYFANRGHIPTASELVEFYTEYLSQNDWFFEPTWVIDQAIAQGGYVPTSASAPEDDQIFTVGMAVLSTRLQVVPTVYPTILSMFQERARDWRLARAQGETLSFAEYMQQHWAL